MRRLGPELDQLMWLVAESNDRHAVEDFEARFPEHVLELGKRMAMVRDLKGAKRTIMPAVAPRFVAPRPAAPNRALRLGWALGAVAMAAFGVAAFYATQRYLEPPRKLPEVPVVEQSAPETFTVIPKAPPAPIAVQEQSPPTSPPAGLEGASPPAYTAAHTIIREKISLTEAIRLIASECGMAVEIGPGLPDIEIGLDYQGVTGLAMLQDMGQKFGFTAFDEGEGRALIIPALDEHAEARGEPKVRGTGGQPPREKGLPVEHTGSLQPTG